MIHAFYAAVGENVVGAAILALAVFGIMRFWKNPAVRHALWLLVLLKLVVPPIVLLPLLRTSVRAVPDSEPIAANSPADRPALDQPADGANPGASPAEVAAIVSSPGSSTDRIVADGWLHQLSHGFLLAAVWGTGSAIWLVIAGVRIVRFHRAVNRAAAADARISEMSAEVADRLGYRRPVEVRVSTGRFPPFLWAVGHARIVLPEFAVADLTPIQLKGILAHEIAHLVRHDHWVRWLEFGIFTCYWWNPIVWWARRELRAAEEQACDARVVDGYAGIDQSYVEALIAMIDRTETPSDRIPTVASALGGEGTLKRRVEAMVVHRDWRLGRLGIAAVTVAAISLFCSVRSVADGPPAAAPAQPTEPEKPKSGAKLPAELDAQLRWGEPARGLRAALVIRPASSEPKGADVPALYVVVQNVSDAPIRFADLTAAPKLRELCIKLDGKILNRIVDKTPTLTDVMLQPREAVLLLMFGSDSKRSDHRAAGSGIIQDALQAPQEILVADMKIEHAPVGAWTGTLRTGETSGAAAAALPAGLFDSTVRVIDEGGKRIVVSTVQLKAVTLTQEYVCQIHSHRHIKVRALEKGYLEAIPVKEGQAVKANDVMFKVIPVLYQKRAEAAIAEAKLAQLEYNYSKELLEKKVVNGNEVSLAEAKLAKANANAELATAELGFSSVRAPFGGIIGRLEHQQGSLVLEGDTLTTLSDNSVMWVYFNVPEARYLEYMADPNQQKEDQQIELVLANGQKFPHVGKFATIDADFNNGNGSIPFRADFPNPDRLLRHGQSGIVSIRRVLDDRIVVPQRATFEVLGKRYVYVVDKDDVAHQREIAVQNQTDDLFVVKQGLEVGDKIIVEGVRQVHDGEKVKYEVH